MILPPQPDRLPAWISAYRADENGLDKLFLPFAILTPPQPGLLATTTVDALPGNEEEEQPLSLGAPETSKYQPSIGHVFAEHRAQAPIAG